jgi:hypothetical protein
MRRATRIATRPESTAALEHAGGPSQCCDMLALRMPELALSLELESGTSRSQVGAAGRACVSKFRATTPQRY